MGTERTLTARLRSIDLGVVDWVLALLLTVGALADASSQLRHGPNAPELAALIVLTGSVAWRRRNPVLATLAAVSALAAFQLASGYRGGGAFEVAAIGLNFYTLGRRARGREPMLVYAGVFAYWLAGAAVVAYSAPGGTVAVVVSSWALIGGLPFAFGRTLATRSALTHRLAASTARLEDEHELRARRAAAEERNRMARELHDVIAHNVSVMVIQCSGARRIVRGDLDAARQALGVVEGSGRDALVELRRIVGVLRHGSEELLGFAAPGLSQLDALVQRTHAAGLPVQLRIEGPRSTLSPDLDLVAYRVVQEALTNAIKHAGPARAEVNIAFTARELAVEVLDTGRGPDRERDRDRDEPGHGLIGMGERVRCYGGELSAGPGPGGGFAVRARIPLDGAASAPGGPASSARANRVVLAPAGTVRWPWLDPVLAGVLLVALEIAVLTSSHRRGPLVLNVIAVAAMALAALWRRRSPLLFVIVIGVLADAMGAYLTRPDDAPVLGIFLVLIPMYTVAAWEERRRAALGLGLFLAGTAIGELLLRQGPVGNFVGAAFALSAAWAAGYAIRSRRVLTTELEHASARLAAERQDRARLAVAGERSRIARELHAVVARSVAAMVVQAEAARSLLERDPGRADAAMSATEDTGRRVLAEMRGILGVLRHAEEVGERAPQPGVNQIYALIQRARERGQLIELSVDGEPGTLPAGVEIGIYRILEDALQSARRQPPNAVVVALRFGEEDLELQLTAQCQGPNAWPTHAMRERVALCGGELRADTQGGDGWRFVARMPRGLQAALA